MPFRFRLQKVLEYRALREEEAKQRFLDAKASRIREESVLEEIRRRRMETLQFDPRQLTAHLDLQGRLLKLDDDERMQACAIAVLLQEEAQAENTWRALKQELEAMVKLREQALDTWNYEEARREQAELDEWAVLRRKPAREESQIERAA